jgi:hypothetical protein
MANLKIKVNLSKGQLAQKSTSTLNDQNDFFWVVEVLEVDDYPFLSRISLPQG